MASIMDKLKKNSTLGNSAILSDSKFFNEILKSLQFY